MANRRGPTMLSFRKEIRVFQVTEASQVPLDYRVLLALLVVEKVKKVSKENQAKEANPAKTENLGNLA